ncbi:hypothetical protein QBC44DRAFT_290598 [Cladorrhinum sp. PSN332]|nr:hypothetical protein QBC44DRAFT_290598 [Cladorrhinum sp. PSN332]
MTLWRRKSQRTPPAPPPPPPPPPPPGPPPAVTVPVPVLAPVPTSPLPAIPASPTAAPAAPAAPAPPSNPPPYHPSTDNNDTSTSTPPSREPPSREPPSRESSSSCLSQTPKLYILAATWGGAIITPSLRAMVQPATQSLTLNLSTLHATLQPDPAPNRRKILTLAYQFSSSESEEKIHILNLPEPDPKSPSSFSERRPDIVTISPDFPPHPNAVTGGIWSDGGDVEILGVFYGPKRIDNQSVMEQLGGYFTGRIWQIRGIGNGFFGEDPWLFTEKPWAVYFRFAGSDIGVQVVTGWEGGLLERPWGR